MSGILQKLIELGSTVGKVTEVHMYDEKFLTVEGKSFEGAKFNLTLHIKEEEKDGN
jgi:hypothetical protein